MIANINDDPIVLYVEIPRKYKGFINYHLLNSDTHYTDGWRDVSKPEFNPEVEKLGEVYFDESTDGFTYPIIQKTEAEIQQEILQQAESSQAEAVQKLLKQKLIEELQNEEDDEIILQNQEAYPIWVADGELQKAGEKTRHFNINNELVIYRCNQDIARTEQFTPRLAIYAYDEIKMGGDYPIWQQPQAHNPYMEGDIVWYVNEGDTLYISTVDNNVHAPNVVEGAWEIYEQ